MIPAAFDYARPARSTRRSALAASAGGQGHRRRPEPAAAHEAAARARRHPRRHRAPRRAQRHRPDRGRRLRDRGADDLRRGHRRTRRSGSPATPARTSATSRSATGARSAARSAHADPASDAPALALALDYSVVLRSVRGERVVPLDGFFTGAVPDGHGARRDPRRGPAPAAGRGRRLLPEARAPGFGLLDRRGLPRSSPHRRQHQPRPRRADRGRRGGVPGQGRRGGAASAATGRPRRSPPPPHTPPTGRPSTATSTPTATIERDGGGLHPSRDRGRARPLAPREPSANGARRAGHPGRRAPGRLAGGGPRPRPDGRRSSAGPRAGACPSDDILALSAADPGPPVTILVLEAGELHEDDAAVRLAEGGRRAGLDVRGPNQSRIDLVRRARRAWSTSRSPSSSGSTGSTRSRSSPVFDGQVVEKGDLVASVKVAPHVVDAAIVEAGARIAGFG